MCLQEMLLPARVEAFGGMCDNAVDAIENQLFYFKVLVWNFWENNLEGLEEFPLKIKTCEFFFLDVGNKIMV